MKVTANSQYPERLSTQLQRSSKAQTRSAKASGQPVPARQTGPVADSALVQATAKAHAQQRPVRISREGEAQALFVYDSLANYRPNSSTPNVDVYV